MSDQDPKVPAPQSDGKSSSDSSPAQPSPLVQWLEPTLLRIARGIEGNTTSVFAIQKILAAVAADISKSGRGTNDQIADLKVEFDAFIGRVDDTILAQKILMGSVHDAKKALDEGRRTFDRAIDESAKHPKYDIALEEGSAAPQELRVFVGRTSVRILDIVWPIAIKQAPTTAAKVAQYIGGSALLAAIGKIIHFVVTHS